MRMRSIGDRATRPPDRFDLHQYRRPKCGVSTDGLKPPGQNGRARRGAAGLLPRFILGPVLFLLTTVFAY